VNSITDVDSFCSVRQPQLFVELSVQIRGGTPEDFIVVVLSFGKCVTVDGLNTGLSAVSFGKSEVSKPVELQFFDPRNLVGVRAERGGKQVRYFYEPVALQIPH
jgi:hypothetical protein